MQQTLRKLVPPEMNELSFITEKSLFTRSRRPRQFGLVKLQLVCNNPEEEQDETEETEILLN